MSRLNKNMPSMSSSLDRSDRFMESKDVVLVVAKKRCG